MSIIQDYAGELLMVAEQQKTEEDWAINFKARMAAANPTLIPSLFPDETDKKNSAETTDEIVKEILDKEEWSRVEWVSPTDVGIEEYEKVLAEVTANSTMRLSAAEVDDGGGWH